MQRRLNMLPRLSREHAVKVGFRNSKLFSLGPLSALWPFHLSKLTDQIIRKFCPSVKLSLSFRYASMAIVTAILGYGVLNVVFRGSKKMVVPIDAVRNVAVMANLKPVRDWSEVRFKGHPVDHLCNLKVFDLAIAVRVYGPTPQPTRTQIRPVWRNWSVFVNSAPEPLPESPVHFVDAFLSRAIQVLDLFDAHASILCECKYRVNTPI